MAGLPPDGTYAVQQNGGVVSVVNAYSGEDLHSWMPYDPASFGPALKDVFEDPSFTTEQKCMTAFWAGYFYAHSKGTA